MDGQKDKLFKMAKENKKQNFFFRVFAICFLGSLLPAWISLLLDFAGGVGLVVSLFLCAACAWAVAAYLLRQALLQKNKDEELARQLYTVSKKAGQHMLLQILQRNTEETEKQMLLLKQSGVLFFKPYYCAAVLKMDDFWLISEDYPSDDIAIFKFSIGNIASELLSEHMTVYYVENGVDSMTFILNMEQIPETGMLKKILQQAIRHEADYFGIGFSAGIGTVAKGLPLLSESYNNALDALEYRLFFGKQSVTEYDSIKGQESLHIDYPYDMEQEILRQAMRFHNRVKTMECLDEFLEQVSHISAEDANLYIHQLGVAVNRALRQADGIQVSHLYSMREFSYFMDSLPTMKEKQQQIRATLDELFHVTAEDSSRKKQGIVQKVEDFVIQNYKNPDVTLEDMAQHVGLSSNYIRRIFREQCGYSPMDYLVNYRIAAAKELLKNTTYTAREVAGMVGYSNTKYFYSLFKKQTGYTTYEYRKSGDELQKEELDPKQDNLFEEEQKGKEQKEKSAKQKKTLERKSKNQEEGTWILEKELEEKNIGNQNAGKEEKEKE